MSTTTWRMDHVGEGGSEGGSGGGSGGAGGAAGVAMVEVELAAATSPLTSPAPPPGAASAVAARPLHHHSQASLTTVSSFGSHHSRVSSVLAASQPPVSSSATRQLVLATGLCIVFMVVEVVGGYLANSLAIMTECVCKMPLSRLVVIFERACLLPPSLLSLSHMHCSPNPAPPICCPTCSLLLLGASV